VTANRIHFYSKGPSCGWPSSAQLTASCARMGAGEGIFVETLEILRFIPFAYKAGPAH
jgi:uncharacterized protein YbbK (DUF523 family)